jgi:O-antigen/teichoic acid export membrane protein
VIRGTALRTTAYFGGLALGLIAVPLLTRYLGVADYGSYVVVGSVLGIAMIFADAGLSAVGVREYAVRDADGRERLIQNLVSARLVLTVLAVTGAVLFTLAAGYDDVLVAGTAVAGIGVVLTMAQLTYAIPLTAGLRFEMQAAIELLRQALAVAGILVLIALGAGLLAFYAVAVPVGAGVLVATLLAVRGHERLRPAVDRHEWRYLVGEAAPAAAASVLTSLFYRVAIVMMSLLSTAEQTGYFGLSSRVAEVFMPVPWLIIGSAFPVLARAADTNRQRLILAFQQLFDMSVILSAGTAFVIVAGAKPAIDLLGGRDFAGAVPVLRIQGVAIALTFLVTLFGGMLWVVRAKRALVIGNLVGVASAGTLTAVLVPIADAKGAATAMLIAEALLAAWLGAALLLGSPDLRPSVRTPAKALGALAAAVGVALMPLPPLASVVLGAAAYLVVLLALRAIPLEVWRATFGGRAE